MIKFRKILKTLTIMMVVGLSLLPTKFAFATGMNKELTDREKAAFIVRDEWTSWVNSFTASLSELDKNATARIYDNMDYYDMQYRFTEKYKKVPEYLDEDGKPTQKLKDLIKAKRKQISGAAATRDYLKFTAIENNSQLSYRLFSLSPSSIDIGYSLDGSTFVAWAADTPITLNAGESVYVWNKKETLNIGESNRMIFRTTSGKFNISGNCNSMINFTDVKDQCFFGLFAGIDVVDASQLILPSTSLGSYCYAGMFSDCYELINAPELPATNLADRCYYQMFNNCEKLVNPPKVLPAKILKEGCYLGMFSYNLEMKKAPEILGTTLATNCFRVMFSGSDVLNNIKIAYTGDFDDAYFYKWVNGVSNTGDFYYNGDDTSNFGSNAIPKDSSNPWNVHNYTSDLKFTSKQAGSTIRYHKTGTLITDLDMQYSYDDINWESWAQDTNITLNNEQAIYVKNNSNTLSLSESNYVTFEMSGKIAASGDINTLINRSNLSSFCYYQLFNGCTALTEPPELISKNLAESCYNRMFNGCTNLTQAPDLPAITLTSRCYEYMFSGCINLAASPIMRATTLANRSCYYMFSGCTSLTQAPVLNVMTMEAGCYLGMFSGSGLVNAPELPATTLANSCYNNMFSGCQNLEYAPMELPATDLAESCYANMFSNCPKLVSSPEMKATTLAANCFENMFASSPKVEAIDISFYMGSFDAAYFNNWVSGVADSGTLYYKGTDTSNYGSSAIPKDSTHMWQIKERTPLTFTSEQDGSRVQFCVSTTWYFTPPDMYYSTDGLTWTSWPSNNYITLNTGEKIYVRNNKRALSNSSDRRVYFQMSGKIAASGDVNSLIRYGKVTNSCYIQLFEYCDALTSAPELPATTLAVSCYEKMFASCTSLTASPNLPATTLADSCYRNMFLQCTSLTSASSLPATTLAPHCYSEMYSLTGLLNPPTLPAETLAESCYSSMFYGTPITTAPTLPATALVKNCYYGMFSHCASLTVAPDLPATTLAEGCYGFMFNGSGIQTGPDIKATTLAPNCFRYMFDYCGSINSVKLAYTGNFTDDYFKYWVYGISNSGTFYYSGSDTDNFGESAIPKDSTNKWTVQPYTP